jgi:hypothetical protein
VSLVKFGAMEAILFSRDQMNLYLHFRIHFPIRVKFGARNLHIIRLSVCEICENRLSEGCTFLTCVNEVNFARVP